MPHIKEFEDDNDDEKNVQVNIEVQYIMRATSDTKSQEKFL